MFDSQKEENKKYSLIASSQYSLPKVEGIIIEIGWIGSKVCFINWSLEEAKKEYMKIDGLTEWDSDIPVCEIILKNGVFRSYDTWGI